MKTHPITGGMIEDGRGSHPEHVQAARHCDAEEASGNVERADEWRKQLGIPTSKDRAATAEASDAHSLKALHEKHDALAERVEALPEAIHAFLNKKD